MGQIHIDMNYTFCSILSVFHRRCKSKDSHILRISMDDGIQFPVVDLIN